MSNLFYLPEPKEHIIDTLLVRYTDGSELRVPYFDKAGAISFLALESEVESFEVISYDGI